MTDEFRGKVAIVTGGGAGIGLAAAGRLAQEGASVVICSDREDQALQRPADCEKRASKSGGMGGDVTSSTDMEGLVDFAVGAYGGVDVLVNSAGVQRYGTVTETEEDVWDEVLGVNLKGIYLAARHTIPEMRRRGGGAIVNVSSVQAIALR